MTADGRRERRERPAGGHVHPAGRSFLLPNPVLTASGCAAAGRELDPFLDLTAIGAVVTKSIMLEPRSGRPTPRMAETPSGMLNSIGLQGPGIEAFLAKDLRWLRERGTRTVVSIAGGSVQEYAAWPSGCATSRASRRIEVNISCPNVESRGQVFACDPLVRGLRGPGRAPAHRPGRPGPGQAQPGRHRHRRDRAGRASRPAPTGVVDDQHPARHGHRPGHHAPDARRGDRRPVRAGDPAGRGARGLAGARRAARTCRSSGMGGIRTGQDAFEFLLAGASAVSVGTVVFNDPHAPARVSAELRDILAARGITRAGRRRRPRPYDAGPTRRPGDRRRREPRRARAPARHCEPDGRRADRQRHRCADRGGPRRTGPRTPSLRWAAAAAPARRRHEGGPGDLPARRRRRSSTTSEPRRPDAGCSWTSSCTTSRTPSPVPPAASRTSSPTSSRCTPAAARPWSRRRSRRCPDTRITAVTVLTSLSRGRPGRRRPGRPGPRGGGPPGPAGGRRGRPGAGLLARRRSPRSAPRSRPDIPLITPGVRPAAGAGSASSPTRRASRPRRRPWPPGADLLVIGRPITGAARPGRGRRSTGRRRLWWPR